MDYKWFQRVTSGFKLQGATRGYRELQRVTIGCSGNRKLQGFTEGYKGLQGVTEGYIGLQEIRESYKGLKGVNRG